MCMHNEASSQSFGCVHSNVFKLQKKSDLREKYQIHIEHIQT